MNCKRTKGFTIIELIVVIAIIAVLAGIITVAVTKYIALSKLTRANAEVSSIGEALAMFYAEYGDYPGPCYEPGCAIEVSTTGWVAQDLYLTVNGVDHYLSEFYKLPSADYFAPGGYYDIFVSDNDGDGKIGCVKVMLRNFVIDIGEKTYGWKTIICQDCSCTDNNTFRMEPYF